MNVLTREWVRKDESDFQLAASLGLGAKSFHYQLCFHCQQASEKYLKALMQELGLVVPRTHDLRALQSQLVGHHAALRGFGRGLRFLTQFAVNTRYPGDNASKRQALAALRWAERVRAAARGLLGLR